MKQLWQRIKCLFGRHDPDVSIMGTNHFTCIIVGCDCCDAVVFHKHFPPIHQMVEQERQPDRRVH